VNEAERALTGAIATAKQAKTAKDACSGLDVLAKKLGELHFVTPPAGFEQAFSTERNALSMKLDVVQEQICPDSGADANEIIRELDSLLTTFSRLQQIGAKP
jgi:hypothetical protein